MSRQRLTSLVLLLALSLIVSPLYAQTKPGGQAELIVATPKVVATEVQTALDALLYDYSTFDLDLAAIETQVRQEGRLSLHLGNQTFDLELEVNDLRAPGYQEVVVFSGKPVVQAPSPVTTYRGHVVGDSDSVVRMSVEPDRFEAYIKTATDWVFVDPLADYESSASAGGVVFYRDQQVKPNAAGTCGTTRIHEQAQDLLGNELPFTKPHDHGATKMAANTLQVATDCDGQYFNQFGNPGSFNRMSGVLNAVDGIYQSEINTSVNITYQQCWPSIPNDPYTSLNAQTTLFQFRDYWNANLSNINRDVAHQFSGKNFSGSTIGIAWVGVICNNASLSYGLVQNLSSSAQRRRVSAHEIGHNLSAGHDNQAPVCSGVSCNGNGPIMCASVQGGGSSQADDFSNCSKSSINNHINRFGSCL